MVDLSTAAGILAFIQTQGYIIIFLIMVLEGAIITYVAAFLASLGYFNIYAILLLSIFGNLIPDIFLFFLGKYSRTNTVEKISKFFGFNHERIEKIERGFSNHAGKIIVSCKLIPGFAIPGLVLAGFSKVPFKKFFIISTTFNVSASVVLTLLGFYSGIAVESMLKYLKLESFALVVLGLLTIAIYFLIRFFKKGLGNYTN